MKRFQQMRFLVASMVLLLVGAMAGVAWPRRPDAPAPAPAAPAGAEKQAKVSIDNFTFTPKALSVAVGTTVTWVNRDDVPHTATAAGDPAAFDSKALDTDEKYSFTFTKPGTYSYFCKVHPHMTGVVTVK